MRFVMKVIALAALSATSWAFPSSAVAFSESEYVAMTPEGRLIAAERYCGPSRPFSDAGVRRGTINRFGRMTYVEFRTNVRQTCGVDILVVGSTQGNRRGQPNCKLWPGTAFNSNTGTCDMTRVGRNEVTRKYDRPNVGCKLGDPIVLKVPLPGGGTRTLRGTCRPDAEVR